jgi:hypothetical protein
VPLLAKTAEKACRKKEVQTTDTLPPHDEYFMRG